MPLEIHSRPLDNSQLTDLAGVLRADPALAEQLSAAQGRENAHLWVGIFNARPVSVALVEAGQLRLLVVHPATRGRGVGTDTLRLTARQQAFSCPQSLAKLAHRAGVPVMEV